MFGQGQVIAIAEILAFRRAGPPGLPPQSGNFLDHAFPGNYARPISESRPFGAVFGLGLLLEHVNIASPISRCPTQRRLQNLLRRNADELSLP